MAVELDHSFTTARPIDESFATILDLERIVPCVEGGSVIEATGADVGQGRDQGQDGGDVDEVHRHGRDRRAGRRGPPMVLSVKSREAGGQGYANADRRRSRSATAAARSTRTRRSRARPRRWARASWPACSTRWSRTSPASSARSRSADGDDRHAADPRGRGAARRRDGAAGGSRPARVPRQRPRRLRLRRVRQRAGRLDEPRADDVQGARPLRPLPDRQRRGDRRAGTRPRSQGQEAPASADRCRR